MQGLEPFGDAIAAFLEALRSSPGYEIATWLLAIVFVWSGVVKLRRPSLAAVAIAQFRVLRRPTARHGAALGAAELGLGVALAAGQAMTVVLAAAALVLAAFTALIARSLLAGEDFPCLCFGEQEDGMSSVTLARTAGLGALAVVLLSSSAGAAARDPLAADTWLALVTAVAALGTLVLLGRAPRLVRLNREVKAHFEARAAEAAS